jgi:hypothetical protein
MYKIIKTLKSPHFFRIVVLVFLIQGTFFALAVNPSYVEVSPSGHETRGGGVVPDGNRHIGAIYFFADRPVLSTPFVSDMQPEDLWMGDLERFPSYFYYYVLSFFVRIPIALDAPDTVNVMVIRFVGLIIGLLALVVFRKIVRELKTGELVTNLSTLALAVTGSFVWLASSENYDILSLLFFFLFVLAALRLFTNKDPKQIYLMALWFFIGSITKYTYIPFMGLAGLMSIGILIKSVGTRYIIDQTRTKLLAVNKWVIIGGVFVLVGSASLFMERIGGNLLHYQSFNPNCELIHNSEECMAFGVYERGYNRELEIEKGLHDDFEFRPLEYTGFWVHKYYTSMYAYVGHIWIYNFWPAMYAGASMLLALIVSAFVYIKKRSKRVLNNPQQKFIGVLVVALIAAQLVFNINTYINTQGAAYAHQGRYLLSAVGFVYVIILLLLTRFIKEVSVSRRSVVLGIFVGVGIIALITNSALPVFLVHADQPEWYTDTFSRYFFK